MTNLYVDDFKLGLDLRRSPLTAQAGSLRIADNCVITQGGEIEKRKAFVKVFTIPSVPATSGLRGISHGEDGSESLFTFNLGPVAGALTAIGTFSSWVPGAVVAVQGSALVEPAPTGGQVFRVATVVEYGVATFFVAGSVTAAGTPQLLDTYAATHNWWQGALTTGFVGVAPMVSGQKMYRVDSTNLYFSGVGDPSVINPLNPGGTGPNTVNPGAGFIDLSRADEQAIGLVGIEAYYKQVAVFSRRAVLMFGLDPDPANNVLNQILRFGAMSNGSILQFQTGDLIFLNDSGIRSLRALNAAMVAGATDLGAPIDDMIQAAIAANVLAAKRSEAIVDPATGRYWLAIGNTIYVLSYWSAAKITAWTTFTLPFTIDNMTVAGRGIYLRSGNDIYAYGGLSLQEYDNCVATVRTPHMPAETPTTVKKSVSLDAMIEGTWSLSVGMAPDNTEFYELAATLTGNSYSKQRLPFAGSASHFSFQLTCSDAAPSRLGALSMSFQKTVEG